MGAPREREERPNPPPAHTTESPAEATAFPRETPARVSAPSPETGQTDARESQRPRALVPGTSAERQEGPAPRRPALTSPLGMVCCLQLRYMKWSL